MTELGKTFNDSLQTCEASLELPFCRSVLIYNKKHNSGNSMNDHFSKQSKVDRFLVKTVWPYTKGKVLWTRCVRQYSPIINIFLQTASSLY
jgi:hypothetical protein